MGSPSRLILGMLSSSRKSLNQHSTVSKTCWRPDPCTAWSEVILWRNDDDDDDDDDEDEDEDEDEMGLVK